MNFMYNLVLSIYGPCFARVTMWPACLLLLLPLPASCLLPALSHEDRQHGQGRENYPSLPLAARKPKQEAGKPTMVIDVSDDVDFAPEYTYASLTKPDMPDDFTICGAYRLQAWTIAFRTAHFFQINAKDDSKWSSMKMETNYIENGGSSDLQVSIGGVSFQKTLKKMFFPETWFRWCLSVDTVAKRVVLVVNGELLEEKDNLQGDFNLPADLKILLGISRRLSDGYVQEIPGQYANYNIFSGSQSIEKMAAMTKAGDQDCGAPGNFVSWEEADWETHHLARKETVGELDGPCRVESAIHVFTADFKIYDHCMDFCEKLGKGRSPPVRTLNEYKTLQRELHAITPDISVFLWMWLAAKDDKQEAVWRDYYTGQLVENYTKPWAPNHDGKFPEDYYDTNCMLWYTGYPDYKAMEEWYCESYDMTCPCEYEEEPHLRMRGLCPTSSMVPLGYLPVYTPKQPASSPWDIFLQGDSSTQIRYNDSSEKWVLTDARTDLRAETSASKMSYVLGKHEWTVTNDVYSCNKGQPYTTMLKLSGCDPTGEFTCNDGQCVDMEERCNQIPNCRDESDEVDCRLLVLKSTYNMKVPPIISTGGNSFNQTQVAISISLLKIVRMEEVQHKIDLQFEIILEWKENRAIYHNLKKETSLNAMTDDEIEALWLPYVIYANTDMKEAVQLEDGLDTTLVVSREGNFTTSSADETIDETNSFAGIENKLSMYQTYTKSFQCLYNLQQYPFDTQVCFK